MSEKLAYKKLKEACFDGTLNRIDRVENPLVDGMFDVNYCIKGVEGWIELKAPTEPRRASTKLFASNHRLSQSQLNWCLRQRHAKGHCWILISTDIRWILIHSGYVNGINDATVEELIEMSFWHQIKPIRGKEKWQALLMILSA
jgi:hypothetical protein